VVSVREGGREGEDDAREMDVVVCSRNSPISQTPRPPTPLRHPEILAQCMCPCSTCTPCLLPLLTSLALCLRVACRCAGPFPGDGTTFHHLAQHRCTAATPSTTLRTRSNGNSCRQ
jgi:hypothetical protein